MEKKPSPKAKRQAPAGLGKPAEAGDGNAPGLHKAILDEEIEALRASARKMLAHADGVEEPLDAIKAFSAFGAQVVRIANLLRSQAALSEPDEADEDTRAAIEAIMRTVEGWPE